MIRPRQPSFRRTLSVVSTGLLLGCGSAIAQTQPLTQGIFTCTDAQGRKITADRPIPACADREQKVLNPSGTVKALVSPPLSQQERMALEARTKLAQEEQIRLAEDKRRERALLTRYPNQAVHDKERAEALAQIGVSRQAALNRTQDLVRQRASIDKEMEFYVKDPSKAPPSLRHQKEETAKSLAAQIRFIADQDAEIQRVNARFEEELLRLKQLWPQPSPAAARKTR